MAELQIDHRLSRSLSPLLAIWFFLAFCNVLLSPGPAFGWGVAGHAIIAEIAESRLSEPALTQVRQLLALHHQTHLAEVASWADEWRFFHPETGPWHFVDIPLTADSYDPARDCPNGNCVVVKIEEFTRVLADRHQLPQDRLEALEYVVHFVGDVHQPLHASNNDDAGGNKVQVTYLGQTTSDRGYPWTLHSIWDTAIIEHHLAMVYDSQVRTDGVRSDVASFSQQLETEIQQPTADTWTSDGLDPTRWAIQSHDLARSVAYRGVLNQQGVPFAQPISIGGDYDEAAWGVIQIQLERAGVRLAATLNAALK